MRMRKIHKREVYKKYAQSNVTQPKKTSLPNVIKTRIQKVKDMLL